MTSLISPLNPVRRRVLLGGLALGLGGAWPWGAAAAARIEGVGASFPSKVYARWAQQFADQHGVPIAYRPTGSGDGIHQAVARQAPFAGTDAPLSAADLTRHRLVQLPMLVGGIVPVVHLPGLEDRRLRLSGAVLADIFGGQLTRWDDPRLAELNPGLNLPPRRIVRAVRADKSGTSEGFTRYLSAVSPGFAAAVGTSAEPRWPGEVVSADGNDGVSALVRATPGAIGYVSHDRVEGDRLAPVLLRNRDGHWTASGEAGFRSAVLASDLHRHGDDTASLMDRPGAETWPITMTSFVLVDAAPPTAAANEAALRFLYWCFMRGDAATKGTGFAPLPVSVQARLVARLSAVQPQQGPRPAFQGF